MEPCVMERENYWRIIEERGQEERKECVIQRKQ